MYKKLKLYKLEEFLYLRKYYLMYIFFWAYGFTLCMPMLVSEKQRLGHSNIVRGDVNNCSFFNITYVYLSDKKWLLFFFLKLT